MLMSQSGVACTLPHLAAPEPVSMNPGLTVLGTFGVIRLLENPLYKEEPDSRKDAPAPSPELVRARRWGVSGNGILTAAWRGHTVWL